jgi:hypothetical protein
MSVPSPLSPCWRSVLTSPTVPPFTSLATRLLVTRLRQEVERGGLIDAAIKELHGFFSNNSFADRDLLLLKG